METLAPTARERGEAMAQDCIGPRVDQIERATALEIKSLLANADAIEDALDDLMDVRNWPLFCMRLSVAMSCADTAGQIAAIGAIRRMFESALADKALATVMADLGVR